jgi:hypothetical protein
MTAVLLHLSDIHIKSSSDPIVARAKNISASMFNVLPSATRVLILVSGDIAFSGKKVEYDAAKQFFNTIKTAILEEASIPVSFVIAPGNHDCNFEQDTAARKILVNQLSGPEPPDIDPSVIECCTGVQSAFFNFRDSMEDPAERDDKLWRSHRFEVDGKFITIDCLNVSWISQLPEEPAMLYFPFARYANTPRTHDPKLVIIHHPLNWYSQSAYRGFRTFIRQWADVLISGHEHEGNLGVNEDVESGNTVYVEGHVLQDHSNLSRSAFNIFQLDVTTRRFLSTCFTWNGTRYEHHAKGSWSQYRDLPVKSADRFQITDSFAEVLDDVGAYLRRPGIREIALGDIFVYPDLRENSDGSDRKTYVNASILSQPEVTAGGVLIAGDEKSGRSSLLHHLYREYHDRDFVPLLIDGKEFRKGTELEIRSSIEAAVMTQYGKTHVAQFEQLPKSRKLLLLDDLDAQVKDAATRMRLLTSLQASFGHLVTTVSEMFEFSEALESAQTMHPLSFKIYHLQQFNYSRRSELTQKWFQLGADATTDRDTLLASSH